MSVSRNLRELIAAEELVLSLAEQHTWAVRRREDEAPLSLLKRVTLGARTHALLVVGGENEEADSDDEDSDNEEEISTSVLTFDPIREEWLPRGATAPTVVGRNAAAVASDGSTVFALGGWGISDDLEAWDGPNDPAYAASRSVERLYWSNPRLEPGGGEVWDEVVNLRLDEGRCFPAAACDGCGRLWVAGGGDSPCRGATTLGSVAWADCTPEAFCDEQSLGGLAAWHEAGQLKVARCGLSLAADARRPELVLVGGYSGGPTDDTYECTAEVFDMGTGRSRYLPDMACPRSGPGVGSGPDGALYVVGGSPDGGVMLSDAERYDPREGRWQRLPPLPTARGYLAACFDLVRGNLHAAGGCSSIGQPLDAFECFDRAAGKWRVLPPMPQARANLAMTSVM